MILLLGPTGSGKSTLLKLLTQDSKQKPSKNEFVELPSLTPTVGLNINNISLGKRHHVEVRELGGSMAPLWKSYYANASGIIFVIDSSNPHRAAAASLQLREVLSCKLPTIIILNKCDVLSATSINEMKYILQLNDLLLKCQQSVSIAEISCKDKTSFQEIFKWLRTF